MADYPLDDTGSAPTLADALRRNALDPYPADLWQRYGPLGSHAMAQRGPWMREHMPSSLADFLAAAIQYAPAGFAARGAALPARWENTYHGTPDPAFRLQNKPIWSEPGHTLPAFVPKAYHKHQFPPAPEPPLIDGHQPSISNYFASWGPDQPGAIAPLRVNTADYATIRPGTVMESLDNRLGSANQLYRDGRNWLGDMLVLLGKKGVRYENLGRDHAPSVLSLDPATVRSRFDPDGTQAKAPAAMPEYLRRALDEDTIP